MKLKDIILWKPRGFHRGLILIGDAALITVIAYIHALAGLAYEFHPFFIIPVLAVSWFLGTRLGYVMSVLAAVVWFIADLMLEGDQLLLWPLLFNTVVRLAIFVCGAWLVGSIRVILLRESQLAREDGLTQLPNRREFYERGRQAFAQAQRLGAPFSAVFLDLDRFKEVNDSLGHEVGDRLLETVADAIRAHVRVSDVPGRLGGDEFVLLLPNMKVDAVRGYVERLRLNLLEAMQTEGWPVTFSIGVASYSSTPQDFDLLLKQADGLMYEVKRGDRDHILLREY